MDKSIRGNVNSMNDQRLYACEWCFSDESLREWIRENGTRGECQWCGSQDVFIVSIFELGSLFRDAASIYVETGDTSGDDIAFLLQGDWDIFSEKIEEAPGDLMRDMTIDILEAGVDPGDAVDLPDYHGYFKSEELELEEEWEEKIIALLSGEPLEAIQNEDELPSRLAVACEDLAGDYEQGYIFYRARIHKDRSRDDRFAPTELGAPPPDKTPAARANRAGEPVLYLSSDADTALSEVRAWKGAAVAIAQMRLCRRLFLVNLLELKSPESPFFEENLRWKLQLDGLFRKFAEELSRPVMPHEQDQLYLPGQHLCELIKRYRYDGVAFPSAMGRGYNVVLFNPSDAEPLEVTYFRINEVTFQFEVLDEHEEIYEEWPYDYLID